MLVYRCYLLDADDHIKSFKEVQAFSDAEATALARQHAQEAKMPFELWRGRQIVYRSVAPLTGRYEVPDPSAA